MLPESWDGGENVDLLIRPTPPRPTSSAQTASNLESYNRDWLQTGENRFVKIEFFSNLSKSVGKWLHIKNKDVSASSEWLQQLWPLLGLQLVALDRNEKALNELEGRFAKLSRIFAWLKTETSGESPWTCRRMQIRMFVLNRNNVLLSLRYDARIQQFGKLTIWQLGNLAFWQFYN